MHPPKLSDYFVAEIVKGWKKEIKKGATIDIVVSGLKSFKDLSQVELALSKISGLKDIQKLYFVGDRALLNATFVGDTVTLAEKIDEISDIKLNVIGLSAYKIELDNKTIIF